MRLTRDRAALLRLRRLGRERCGGWWTTVIYAVVAIGLAWYGAALAKKLAKSPLQDDKPTTLTIRGSYTNWLIGPRRVSPLFAGAWRRNKQKEKVQGGKGFGSSAKQDVWYESGWHQLGIVPGTLLRRIRQQGHSIFEGPITPLTHPSGTQISLGAEGIFAIYWGEPSQPINTSLGAADQVGISSRWPSLFYIEWITKRLGQQPIWPPLEYEVETQATGNHLTQSAPNFAGTDSLTGPTFNVIAATDGVEGTGNFEIAYAAISSITYQTSFELAGNTMTSGKYETLRTEVKTVFIPDPDGALGEGEGFSTLLVFPIGGVTGADNNGTIQAYEENEDGGVNAAHAIADLLFEPWPVGLALDKSEWDLDSLEALGVEGENDVLITSWLATQGEQVDSVLGRGIQDLGVVLPLGPLTGKIEFRRLREPSGPFPFISRALQAPDPVETNMLQGEKHYNRVLFVFSDRAHGYSDMPISVDEDGEASYLQYQNAQNFPISIAVDLPMASKISERRSQEDLGGGGAFEISTNRGSRELYPGDVIEVEGIPEILRIASVELSTTKSTVKIQALVDSYGVAATGVTVPVGGGQLNQPQPGPDLFEVAEVPEYLLQGDPQTIIVPRIRDSLGIAEAAVHFSSDDMTYTLVGTSVEHATGGTLVTALLEDGRSFLPQGPTFTAEGPDISTVLDLTGDVPGWRRGRQLVLFQGGEIGFVQKVTSLGGGQYRLDGLIRARYDTRRQEHEVAERLWIFPNTLESFQDVLLAPAQLLYVKSQPESAAGALLLSQVAPEVRFLKGKGVVPPDPQNLRVVAPFPGSPTWQSGQDLTFRWTYLTPGSAKTGAGLQPAGTVHGPTPMAGAAVVRLTTAADVEQATFTLTGTDRELSITNAALVAAFGLEPTSFKVKVRIVRPAGSSGEIELLVTRV